MLAEESKNLTLREWATNDPARYQHAVWLFAGIAAFGLTLLVSPFSLIFAFIGSGLLGIDPLALAVMFNVGAGLGFFISLVNHAKQKRREAEVNKVRPINILTVWGLDKETKNPILREWATDDPARFRRAIRLISGIDATIITILIGPAAPLLAFGIAPHVGLNPFLLIFVFIVSIWFGFFQYMNHHAMRKYSEGEHAER